MTIELGEANNTTYKHSEIGNRYFQPFIELLGSVEVFGSNFDKSEHALLSKSTSHLEETLDNITRLRTRAFSSLEGIAGTIEHCAINLLDAPDPGVPVAAAFLTEFLRDISIVEGRVRDRLAKERNEAVQNA